MDLFMKEISKLDINMEKESNIMQMEIYMMENFIKITVKDTGNINGNTFHLLKYNLKTYTII
jgi:hypothetical protein